MTPSRPAEGTTQDLRESILAALDIGEDELNERESRQLDDALSGVAARLDTQERERINLLEQRDHLQNSRTDELERLRDGLRRIAETARWYADNGQRLAHEVDHALCVEVLDTAERALEGSLLASSSQPGEGTAA